MRSYINILSLPLALGLLCGVSLAAEKPAKTPEPVIKFEIPAPPKDAQAPASKVEVVTVDASKAAAPQTKADSVFRPDSPPPINASGNVPAPAPSNDAARMTPLGITAGELAKIRQLAFEMGRDDAELKALSDRINALVIERDEMTGRKLREKHPEMKTTFDAFENGRRKLQAAAQAQAPAAGNAK